MRFIQPDTVIPSLADAQSWNRYSYVGNAPLNFADPSGHIKVCTGYTSQGCSSWYDDGDEGDGLDLGGDGDGGDDNSGGTPNDSDGDGVPELPDPTFGPVTIGSEVGCDESTYVECFYAREMFVIDGDMRIDNDQFSLLLIAVFFDITSRHLTWQDRTRYDTPFWDAAGAAPGRACFGGECYSRVEVNYFAQGMWSAAKGEPLVYGEKVVVGGWKELNHLLNSATYPSSKPSAGTLYWFEVGYQAYKILNQNHSDILAVYTPR